MTVSWLIRAVAFGLLAITLPLAVRGLYGPQGALVNVRWQASVGAAERQRLETEWQLVDGQEVSPSTWHYDLTAPTESRLRAIVAHAAVADTHNIDRQRYVLAPEATRTTRRGGPIIVGAPVAVEFVDRLALVLAVLAGLCVLVRHPMQVLRESVAGVWPFRGEDGTDAVEISGRTLERTASVTAIAVGAAALVAIAARAEIFANDDTYIYFNYAKNFVAGRPFAYDPRNIASEGFTSAIYLLLLVPFEAAGINMMFAAVILNLAAIALILYLGYQVLRADRILEGGFLFIAVSLFAVFIARDTNIPTIVGRGLETMLGPASVLWAILHLARVHQAGDEATRCRAVTMFLVASFLSFLTRPENIVLLAAVGVLILPVMWRRGELACLLKRLGTFVAALGAYFAGKWLLFGDVMQTSYYRKMRADGAGSVILNLAAIALILYLGYQVLRADRILEGGFLFIAVSLFAVFIARDTNIPTIVGRGLETMLGPASVLWAILHLARGTEYVLGALTDYWRWILFAGVLAACVAGLALWRRRARGWKMFRCLAPRSSVLALAVVAGGTLVVFLPSEPIVGYAYRYLVDFYVFLYLLVAAGVAYLLSVAVPRVETRVVYARAIVTGVVSILWIASIAVRDTGAVSVVERLRLYTRAQESTAQHHYIRIGEFLRDRIPDIEKLTLVFGDAGVFPYVLGSRFVDANGLTEPYLARLFREPNGPEKARKFADYVLSWQPDIIIVAFGGTDDGRWESQANIHSPFLGPTPISVFRAYRGYGIGYVCTVSAYYNLHFGVRRTSKHFTPATEALLEYCGQNGHILNDGLTVTLGGEEVHFPRLTP